MASVWLLLGSGPAISVRSIRLDFPWPLAVSLRRPPLMRVGLSWISLDSLVRIETFQWVTGLEAGIIFRCAFSLALAAPQRESAVEAMRKRRIVHRASLIRFLIFCNKLSSEPFPFGRLNPKATRSSCRRSPRTRPARAGAHRQAQPQTPRSRESRRPRRFGAWRLLQPWWDRTG